MSESLQPHGLQHARLSCPSPSWSLLRLMSFESVMPSYHLIPCHPLLLLPSIFPSIRVSSNEFASGGQSTGASASASVLPVNIQDWFPLELTDLISLLPRDSQKSSLAPQFKGINSLALSLFYFPALTSVHDYWENHSFDCRQSNVSLFLIH